MFFPKMALLQLLLIVEVYLNFQIINQVGCVIFLALLKRKHFILLRNVQLRNDDFHHLLHIFLKIYQQFSLFLVGYQLLQPMSTQYSYI